MKLLLEILGGLVLLGGGYFLYILVKGKEVVDTAPRVDMFICDKGHGPLPKTALINFLGQDYCSICFHSSLKNAERGKL